MNDQSQIIRRGRKFEQVLEGARGIFMADGYEGASVDGIARAAQVSKATLYSYFPDKRHLFLAVASAECARVSREILDAVDLEAAPREVLTAVGRHFLTFLTSSFGLKVFRICVAEADRFPDLGRQFFESGPRVMEEEMAAYFCEAEERGELSVPDPRLASHQFAELCKADLWLRLIFGVAEEVDPKEVDRIVESAVGVFLARYGT